MRDDELIVHRLELKVELADFGRGPARVLLTQRAFRFLQRVRDPLGVCVQRFIEEQTVNSGLAQLILGCGRTLVRCPQTLDDTLGSNA